MNQSLSEITKALLFKHKIKLSRRFGQNLLIDKAALDRVIETAELSPKNTVIEIGTGTGILTKALALAAKKVISFEIDHRIIEVAKEYLKDIKNIELINEDFLKYDFPSPSPPAPLPHRGRGETAKRGVRVVANVPYYITSPIIEKIFENKDRFSKVILTVQKEFAQRMIAKPDTKDYGSFTIFVNYHTRAKIVSYIPRSSFLPQPDVGSAILSLEIRKKPAVDVKSEKTFFEAVRASFSQRRKTLRNCLISKFDAGKVDSALQKSKIDPKRRGETLSIEEFARLADEIYSDSL